MYWAIFSINQKAFQNKFYEISLHPALKIISYLLEVNTTKEFGFIPYFVTFVLMAKLLF